MSKSIGQSYTSLIPSFSDDASIEEAFSMYHYGVEGWQQGQQISQNSIEGAFVSVHQRIDGVETEITNISGSFVQQVSASSSPNVITPQNSSTIPLTIKGVVSQTANLQEWKNSTDSTMFVISPSGNVASAGYISVGSPVLPTTTGISVVLSNSSHKGITVRASSSQSSNLQEWQNNSGSPVSFIDNSGVLITIGSNSTKSSSFTLATSEIGKTVFMTSASSQVVTIPLNSSVPFAVGTRVDFIQYGDGEVSFAVISGVTLNSESSKRKINGKYVGATLIKTGTDEWLLIGALKS